MTAAASAPRPAEIQGLVDSATTTHLFGWAWNAAAAAERITIELRLGDEVVATTLADQDRVDLAPAGIGDGQHAFALPLQPEWRQRPAELAVVARAADGTEVALAIRIRRAEADANAVLQKLVETVGRAHRELRQDLDQLARRLPPEEARLGEQLNALGEGQAALDAKLETLMVWLTRLDERLVALPVAAVPQRPVRGLDVWQRALGGILGIVLLGACIVTAALLGGPG